MASNQSSVTILALNGRQHTLKVTPHTSIMQVLEEACKIQGVNPSDFDLKHGNKILDTSASVQHANIPNNAMLELQPASKIRKEGNVTIGIQLASGERLMGSFPPSCSVWDVVCHCLSGRNENPNRGDGSSIPVCVYLRQTISGDEMKNKTLRSLGLTSGNAMFRLLYRQADHLHEQAHVSSPLTRNITESIVSESNGRIRSDESTGTETNIATQEEANAMREQYQGSSAVASHWDSTSDGHWGSTSDSHWGSTSDNHWGSTSDSYWDSTSDSCWGNTSGGRKAEAYDIEPERSFSTKSSVDASSNSLVSGNINLSGFSIPSNQRDESISKNLNLEQNCSLENPMDVDSVSEDHESTGMKKMGTVIVIGERNAILFNLNDVSSMPKLDLPDDFYETTIDDVRYLLSDYRRERKALENKPLELQSQKQNVSLQHWAQYGQTVIRVLFPDRLVLQGVFPVDETVKNVMEFVRNFLEDEKLDFYLYISPPKTNLSSEKTLLESKLLPAAVVIFGCAKQLSNYLKPAYKSQLSDPEAANQAAAEFRCRNVPTIPSNLHDVHIDENVNVEIHPQQTLDQPSTSNTHSLRRTDDSDSSKMPKWLKLSKK